MRNYRHLKPGHDVNGNYTGIAPFASEPYPELLWPEDPNGPQSDDDNDEIQPLHQWRPQHA